jgi:hypothetical protein
MDNMRPAHVTGKAANNVPHNQNDLSTKPEKMIPIITITSILNTHVKIFLI